MRRCIPCSFHEHHHHPPHIRRTATRPRWLNSHGRRLIQRRRVGPDVVRAIPLSFSPLLRLSSSPSLRLSFSPSLQGVPRRLRRHGASPPPRHLRGCLPRVPTLIRQVCASEEARRRGGDEAGRRGGVEARRRGGEEEGWRGGEEVRSVEWGGGEEVRRRGGEEARRRGGAEAGREARERTSPPPRSARSMASGSSDLVVTWRVRSWSLND